MRALVLSLLFGVSSIICSGCAQAQNQHSSLAGRVFVYATPCGPREALTSTVTIRVERKGETVAEVVARAPRYRGLKSPFDPESTHSFHQEISLTMLLSCLANYLKSR